jgi:hypothetical protein
MRDGLADLHWGFRHVGGILEGWGRQVNETTGDVRGKLLSLSWAFDAFVRLRR